MTNTDFSGYQSLTWLRLCLCLGMAVLTGACASHTSVSSQWVDTNFRGSQFERVLVVGVSENTDRRMSFEDAVAFDLRSSETQAWPSSRLMDPTLEVTKETLAPVIKQQQVEAIVVTRVTRMEVKPVEVEGRSRVIAEQQQSGQDYVFQRQKGTIFRYDYTEDVESTYVTTEYTTELTTDVYAAATGEHIYTIVSTATQQETLADVIDVLSDEIAKRLRRDKVIR